MQGLDDDGNKITGKLKERIYEWKRGMLECHPLPSAAPPITPKAREVKVWCSVWNYTDAREMRFRTSPRQRSLPASKNVSSWAGKAAWRVGIMEGGRWGSPCTPRRVWWCENTTLDIHSRWGSLKLSWCAPIFWFFLPLFSTLCSFLCYLHVLYSILFSLHFTFEQIFLHFSSLFSTYTKTNVFTFVYCRQNFF